ncbi:hypothetical protein ACQ4WX_15050 [Streptomyces lasalocidi]
MPTEVRFDPADPPGSPGRALSASTRRRAARVAPGGPSAGRTAPRPALQRRHRRAHRRAPSRARPARHLQWAPQIRAGTRPRRPRGARTAPVHENGIAAVAERTLLDGGHEGAVHRPAGPQPITDAEQVAVVGAAVGRELTFVAETRARRPRRGSRTCRRRCSNGCRGPSRAPSALRAGGHRHGRDAHPHPGPPLHRGPRPRRGLRCTGVIWCA